MHLSLFYSDFATEEFRHHSGHDEEAWGKACEEFRKHVEYAASALEWLRANERDSLDLVVLKETRATVTGLLKHYRSIVKELPKSVRDALKAGG